MLLVIVFSKNRALQLNALLESMKKRYKEWQTSSIFVLYKTTSDEFEKGYEIVKQKHPEFTYIKETNLTQDIRNIFNMKANVCKYTALCVDDIIWKDDFSLTCNEIGVLDQRPELISYSLRMYPGIYKCYTEGNIITPAPHFNGSTYYWIWTDRNLRGDWAYAGSIDFDIYKTFLMQTFVNTFEFPNVNSIESILHANIPQNKPFMVCSPTSKVFNIPLNRVQNTHQNLHMDVSVEGLNNRFLNGEIIDVDAYYKINNSSPHWPTDLKWKKD